MKGTYAVQVSTWEPPGPGTRCVDNRYGRDSVVIWRDGRAMEVSIEATIDPSEDMADTLHNLMSAIEAAGFTRK